jgi:CRP-like cAMP-binding protein
MSMLTNLDLICRVPMFAALSPGQAEFLAEAAVKRRFKRGEAIVEQDKKSNALYIILAGRARVLMTDGKKREVILATLQMGDHIGEMSLIDGQPHSATVEAIVQTDVLVLGRAAFASCLADSATMAQSVMKGLVSRLREADRKISTLALMSVYGRVADVLLEYAKASPTQDMVIHEKISRQEIAKMVGASREMVSRVMKDFEKRGLVEPLENKSTRINIQDHLAMLS